METTSGCGAINPYALAEGVLRKRIDWNRIERPLELLERTLKVAADDLFDPGKGSPVFALQKSIAAAHPGPDDGPNRQPAIKPGTLTYVPDLSPRIDDTLRKRLLDIIIPLPDWLLPTEYDGANWADRGDYFEEGSEFFDPVQGAVGDCGVIAALASVAMSRPYAIVHRNRTTGSGDPNFVNRIDFAMTPGNNRQVEVSDLTPVYNGTTIPLFARSSEWSELWPALYEKAFAKLYTGNITDKPDIRRLNGAYWPHDASARLLPGTQASSMLTGATSSDALWNTLRANCVGTPGNSSTLSLSMSGRTMNPMTAWTYPKASAAPDKISYDASTGIVAWHAYSILGWIMLKRPLVVGGGRSERYIVLRNPWGTHEGLVDTLNGNFNSHEVSWTRHTPLNAAGVFAMKIEAFKRYYMGMGLAS